MLYLSRAGMHPGGPHATVSMNTPRRFGIPLSPKWLATDCTNACRFGMAGLPEAAAGASDAAPSAVQRLWKTAVKPLLAWPEAGDRPPALESSARARPEKVAAVFLYCCTRRDPGRMADEALPGAVAVRVVPTVAVPIAAPATARPGAAVSPSWAIAEAMAAASSLAFSAGVVDLAAAGAAFGPPFCLA